MAGTVLATILVLLATVSSSLGQYDDIDDYGYGSYDVDLYDGYGEYGPPPDLYYGYDNYDYGDGEGSYAQADYGYGYDGYEGSYDYDGYGYGYGYDGYDAGYGYGLYGYGDGYYYEDEYGYYMNDDLEYYEYYGYYANDFGAYGAYDEYGGGYDGYDEYYYYEDYYDITEECFVNSDGKPELSNNTASCNIRISGVDVHATMLSGGIDGVYQLQSCWGGKAMYLRKDSPVGEDRTLWYSTIFGDWDVSRGTTANEADILMYGGEMERASVPLFVTSWHLGADLKTDGAGVDDYLPIPCTVLCADGTKYKEGSVKQFTSVAQPLLTPEELEAKYQRIYDRYSSSSEPSPTVSFSFVVLLVMLGLTIVLAIPYFLLKKKDKAGGASSFAQILQQSRKKASGHVN